MSHRSIGECVAFGLDFWSHVSADRSNSRLKRGWETRSVVLYRLMNSSKITRKENALIPALMLMVIKEVLD